jgi:hypothetical protein
MVSATAGTRPRMSRTGALIHRFFDQLRIVTKRTRLCGFLGNYAACFRIALPLPTLGSSD